MVLRAELLIATLMLTAFQPVLAQGMQAGAMQSMIPSSAIGSEQDSLLPPEVVPLDPNMASQVQSRQAGSMSSSQASNVPGLSAPQASNVPGFGASQANNVPGLSAPQTNPRDLRNQALGQLLGNQTTLPPEALKPWRAGQLSTPAQAGFGMNQGQIPGSIPAISGMPPGMMPQQGTGMAPASQPGAPNYQMANNQGSNPGYVAQSQTLTGGSQNQPQQINTHRGGFSNMFSYASTLGLGVLANPFMSGFMMAGPFSRF